MLKINSYQDFEYFLNNKLDPKGIVFGVGVTSFMRFFPGLFLHNYKLITFKDCKDNEIIKDYVDEIFILKKRRPTIKLPYTNANQILRNKTVRNYLNSYKGKKYLFLYKENTNIKHAIKDMNLQVIGNSPRLNKMFEDKVNFRKILKKINLDPIPGDTVPLTYLQETDYQQITAKYGAKFVIQMPQFLLGGGKGTKFIDSKRQLNDYLRKVEDGVYKKKEIDIVNITKYVEGISCSVTCCATKYGTLVSRVQQQILDIPQVISPKKGCGLFVGHVFGLKFNRSIINQVNNLSIKLGDYMYQKGFKGIFGIDMIINTKENKVYPVECNARYTGALPMISMLHMKNRIIPLDWFHFLEFLKIPYKIDAKKLNKMYQKPIEGSHIVLSNIRDYSIEVKKELEVGLYKYNLKTKKIEFKKSSIFYDDLKSKNDFILVDGVPKQGQIIKKWSRLARIVHVLFNADILNQKHQLKKEYLEIVYAIYKSMFGKKQP